MTFIKRKWCRRRRLLHTAAMLAFVAATILTSVSSVACAKLETQIKLLINDEALLLEQAKQQHPPQIEPHTHSHQLEAAAPSVPRNAEEQQHYEMYHSSDLRRLSYETIHRILRDENEPMYRREDAEMHYYQKRSSYQPTHEIFRRAADDEQPPVHLLNFTRANLTDLALIASVNVTAVRVLDVSYNRLAAVNLSRFAQLQHADLTNNLLTALPATNRELKLTTLNINGNLISGATPTAVYEHLRELHLSSNRIANLASLNLSALNALEILDLSCNRIENLQTAFFPQRMHNLKFLNLANNRLSSIYRETFYNLLSLNTLVLSHNNITDIDYETFLALPNLQYLDLSQNQLHGESIRALQGIPDLVGLSIAYNPELGGNMQEFVASWSLKEFDASGTGLCQIPAALAQSVRTLKLSDNWLKIINCGDLDSYPLLQYLDLSQSRIEDIEDDALGRLEILEVLFLDHNSLHSVPISLPTSLQHLFLQHNEIMDIQLQAFQGLNQLQTLDLSGNKLLYLPALSLPRLLTLNIQSSELRGLNQAIVNTLPRLRDMLLEDNPIKCSDLLGIAEWASPCRLSDRAVSNSVLPRAETIDADELGQFQAKIDLKQQFVQMHNFLEKFKNNCEQKWDAVAVTAIPPICAIEMDAETETSAMEEVEFIMESNLPTEPEIQAKGNNNANNNNEKLYDNHSANFAKSFQQSAQNNDTASPPTAMRIEEANETKAKASTAATIISTRSKTPTKNNSKGKVLTTMHPTDKSFAAAVVVPVTSKSAFVATKGENFKKLPTVKSATIALTPVSSKLPTTTAAAATATSAANRDELHLATTIINAKEVASKTTTATATTVVINSTRATTKKEIPSTSSLNNSIAVVVAVAKTENVDTTTATTIKAETTITSVATAMEKTPTETTTVAIHVLPQTILPTIKSDNNNYVETTSSSLLNQQGLKTSTAAAALADVTAREDKVKNDSNGISSSNSSSKMLPVSLSSKRQQLNFNGISGQQHIGRLPTTENNILANQQHQQQQQQQQHNASNTTTHRHEPLQLHIKNRHLIGTPLLMHKGHNILVETEQLMLPTAAAAATTTTTAVDVTTTSAIFRTADDPTKAMNKPATAGKRTKADKLAESQNFQKLIEPRHFLADSDKLQQQKTEAIFAETNEQNENPVKFAAAVEITDMRSLPATTEIINTKTTNAVTDDTSTEANNNKVKKITKMPRIHPAKKKKLSLTMKKMTITKHAGTPQSLTTSKHHQSLNTPRENEAAPLTGSNRDSDLVDWQTFKEIKTEQNFIEPKPQPHKHSAVNTPTDSVVQHFPQHELPQLSAVEQQLMPENSPLSKSEQLLDVRKNAISSGHPGLVILISLIAFIILLMGLVQVYRCDKPWRQQLAQQQRPHQLSRIGDCSGEDGSNSFLSYQQQRQPNTAPQKWHHSTRLLPPRCSPLHNLHVRELQQISVVEHRQTTARNKKSFQQTLNLTTSSSSGNSSSSSDTTNSHYSSTGAIMEDDAFYIEMTPDSGQPASNQHLHSDLLPMELLSSSTTTTTTASSTIQQNLMDATEIDATNEQQHVARASIAPPVLPLFSGESAATSHNKTNSDKRLPVVKLTPTTRKFGLW